MPTLEDLRTQLAERAEIDTALPTRAGDVRRRVGRLRARRRAGAAGVLAAVVAVAGAVVWMPRDHGAEPLAGHALAEHVEVLGLDYQLSTTEQSDPGQKKLSVTLPKSDREQVVALAATDLDGGRATLAVDGEDTDRIISASALDAPVSVDSSKQTLTVTVRGAGPDAVVGVAVYRRSDVAAQGIAGKSRVFPRTVGDARLVNGAWSTGSSATVTVDGADKVRRIAYSCIQPAGRTRVWLRFTIDGKPEGGMQCDTLTKGENVATTYGERAGDSYLSDALTTPGTHVIRVDTATGYRASAKRVHLPDTEIGVAGYTGAATVAVGGLRIDRVTEFDGQRWTVARVVPIAERTDRFSTTLKQSAENRALGVALSPNSAVDQRITAVSSGSRFPEGSSEMIRLNGVPSWEGGGPGQMLLAGDPYTISLSQEADQTKKKTFGGALVIYRRLD
ncbi:MAG: hypothetical protein QM638_14475 [Nocardioides sp.]|uniref:hypothetical protein n=1 Tax=Nocardioides sp. TaxID=35761 RepID=UPI0039E434A6